MRLAISVLPNHDELQGIRYQYLALVHEQGHILNLADAIDSHSSLMQSGVAMLELSTNEQNAITSHYKTGHEEERR